MEEEPPAKRRVIGPSGRVTLDVGGTKFVAASWTLTANSAYFASILSENWIESNNGAEIFLDQDPVAFGKLLAYMRRGMIKVDGIDTDVLALAEFLGTEKLLLAVKVRWYCNIGKGPVLFQDEENANRFDQQIAAAFDQEHGGILKSISDGLFPFFLKQNNVSAEKDFAVMTIRPRDSNLDVNPKVRVHEVGKGNFTCGGIIGALNGLHANGYTMYENQTELGHCCEDITFSRMSHFAMLSGCTNDVLIPAEGEIGKQMGSNHIKQFAVHIYNADTIDGNGEYEVLHVPAEFGAKSDPYDETTLDAGIFLWLQRQNFVTREKGFAEDLLVKFCLEPSLLTCHLYSRQIPRAQHEPL